MTTLVIRFSALGDVAMLASVLRETVAQHPEERFIVLSREKMRPLFDDLECVTFLSMGEPIPWKTIDLVLDAHSVWRSWRIDLQALCHLKPVRCIRKGHLAKWRFIHTHKAYSNNADIESVCVPITPMLDRYRHLLSPTPATCRPRFLLGSSLRDKAELSVSCEEQYPTQKRIGIAPFAAHKGKIYPLDKMEQVVRLLSEKGYQILLFGAGKKEREILEQWADTYPNVTSLADKQTLEEDLQTMRSLQLMLTMDSANMHLASLVGTQVISLWGATHPAMGYLGYGQHESDCIQLSLPCRPCSVYGNKACRYGDYRCLDIEPAHIVHFILQALCES